MVLESYYKKGGLAVEKQPMLAHVAAHQTRDHIYMRIIYTYIYIDPNARYQPVRHKRMPSPMVAEPLSEPLAKLQRDVELTWTFHKEIDRRHTVIQCFGLSLGLGRCAVAAQLHRYADASSRDCALHSWPSPAITSTMAQFCKGPSPFAEFLLLAMG